MVAPLLERSVTRLIIESCEGRGDLDRQVLIDQLRPHGDAAFDYDYLPPHGDPLLWVADGFAWCSPAGGEWRGRIDGSTTGQDGTRP